MNVTDSGPSDNTSKLIDLQLGSVTKFKVTKLGQVIATNYTGSFSGSTFVKDQSSSSGTKYLVFTNGTGQRTLGLDTNLSYDASSNTLTTNGSINSGGDIDSTNAYPLLMSSPTSLDIASSATTIKIGSNSAGGYTQFDSKQVRGHFTGSFTGSFSGSKGNFNKLSGSSGRITGRINATSFTGSISGAYASFNKITGSTISGAYAAFNKITGSTGRIENNLVINGTLQIFQAITGSSNLFASGAGSPIAGYVGILIGGTKYKLPLYPWS